MEKVTKLGAVLCVLAILTVLLGQNGTSPPIVPSLFVLFTCIFLPAVVALARRHRHRLVITALNISLIGVLVAAGARLTVEFFLPLVFIGWLVDVIWACTSNVEPAAA
jgi:hypothetical protein